MEETIGPLVDRPTHPTPWGYRSSDGMGLLEFLDWCEDLHMEPLLAVFAGYSLGRSISTPGPDLEPYVKDALDEIEYVTGDADHEVGRRARQRRPSRAICSEIRRSRQRRPVDKIGPTTNGSPSSTKPSRRSIRISRSSPPCRSPAHDIPTSIDDHFYRTAQDSSPTFSATIRRPQRAQNIGRRMGHARRHTHPQLRCRSGRRRLDDRHGAQ